MKTPWLGSIGTLSLLLSVGPAMARDLNFEDRVRAQEAIERVRYSHRIGDPRSFEEAVPRVMLENKVRTYLAESLNLEERVGETLAIARLRVELDRVTRSTRMPTRLEELFAALEHDDVLIQECLIRPALVHRLLRTDRGLAPVDTSDPGAACDLVGGWRPLPAGPGSPSPRSQHTAVWTGNEMIVWGGALVVGDTYERMGTGARYDPALDHWTETNPVGAPRERWLHSAVWTGTRMIVWGGDTPQGFQRTGGLYDPVSDSWTPTSTMNAPALDSGGHAAVWTGNRMLVWGGTGSGTARAGGQFDPRTNSWSPMSLVNGPAYRSLQTGVWTGSRMVIWGGENSSGFGLATGGRYDPLSDTWAPTTLVNAPSPRSAHTAIWTGDRMIVWGGGAPALDTGALYDPLGDTWETMAGVNAPTARVGHTAVWTGDHMLVWGGVNAHPPAGSIPFSSGGRYDPVSASWETLSLDDAPSPRWLPVSVFSGEEMIVWGGLWGESLGDGGAFCACAAEGYHRDADSDGFGDPSLRVEQCSAPAGYVSNGSDCDDGDASIWGSSSEVLDLIWSNSATLTWSPPASPGGSVVLYDLLRSQSADDFETGGTCVAADSSLTTASEPDEPAVGSAFHYLVRAQSACPVGGEGPLGWSSNGAARLGRACP